VHSGHQQMGPGLTSVDVVMTDLHMRGTRLSAMIMLALSDDARVIMPIDVVMPVDVSPDCEGA
jgi:hypothetical protein